MNKTLRLILEIVGFVLIIGLTIFSIYSIIRINELETTIENDQLWLSILEDIAEYWYDVAH